MRILIAIVVTCLLCTPLLAFNAKDLPLDNRLKGTASFKFDTEGMQEGLRYLGTSIRMGEPVIYAFRYENNYMYRYHAGKELVLGEIRGREIRGFGTMDDETYLVLTEGPKQILIERFNSRGTRIFHIPISIELETDELYSIEFDGDYFYIIGPERGHKVGRFGGKATSFKGFPIFGTKEFLDFEFSSGFLEISFLPQRSTYKVRIPLFYPPDHIELFRKTSRGLYFLLETELNMQTFESTFFIYKIDSLRVRQVGGLYLNLPYRPKAERSFWFDAEGNIYVTTLENNSYQVWYVGHF